MKLNDFQESAMKTAIYGEEQRINYPTLGLCGESGEVANKVKKVFRDRSGIFDELTKYEIAEELGDVLWYVAVLAHDLGFTLDCVASMNITKLESRMMRGVIGGSGDDR